ncbi:MAG: GlsB/YeaQ/YmgE family stress response membrane protein [Bacteroides sp.]|nr:GlsB/YeaQ/YmgE family stress response membrane protein [Bacteroides sp.]
MSFVWFIFIGILSGLIAGKLMHGGGFGWVVNLIVGVAGGVIGGWMFGALGIHTTSIIGSLITSVCGAVVLLYIVGLINRSVNKRN